MENESLKTNVSFKDGKNVLCRWRKKILETEKMFYPDGGGVISKRNMSFKDREDILYRQRKCSLQMENESSINKYVL